MKRVLIFAVIILLAGEGMNSSVLAANSMHSSHRQNQFTLSRETPISTGHGFVGISSSTEPVDILSYGVHFRIPRNYIDAALHDTRDHTMDFSLVTLYPNFIGANAERKSIQLTKEDKIWIWGSSQNLIEIETVGGELGKNGKNSYNTEVFLSEKNEPDHPWKYGLLKSTKSFSARTQNIYLKRPTKDHSGFVAFCTKEGDPVPQCVMYIRVSKDLLLHCEFHTGLLPHWREIDNGLNQLIQSFIVKEEQ